VAYWIKVSYERNEYVVDLDRISAFACTQNGKVTFWLPDSAIPIIINRQSNADGYQQVMDYVQQVSFHSIAASWIKVIYERNEYVVDLNRISSFSYSQSGRITFWLPNCAIPIIINKQSDPDSYEKILDYIKRKTGHAFL
jgi:hypothetical protein